MFCDFGEDLVISKLFVFIKSNSSKVKILVQLNALMS